MFLSCLKATELIEKRLHFSLSFKEKLQLKVHKMMCDACTNYDKQSSLIEKGVEKLGSNKESEIDLDMEAYEKSILEKLKGHQSKTVE